MEQTIYIVFFYADIKCIFLQFFLYFLFFSFYFLIFRLLFYTLFIVVCGLHTLLHQIFLITSHHYKIKSASIEFSSNYCHITIHICMYM